MTRRTERRWTRRELLAGSTKSALAAVGVPYVIAASALGGDGKPPPSERITIGMIGLGWKGFTGCWGSLVQGFLADPMCRVRAVCDIDQRYLKRAKVYVDKEYGDTGCKEFHDFRDLLARPDIDAVAIATPDHWHAVQTIWACRQGKDVYCEKPLSLTIREGRAMVDAARRYGRVVQTGSQSRSTARLRFACEAVRSGRIGKVSEVRVSCGWPSVPCNLPGEPVPDYLDWEFWLGPAPWRPYNPGIHPMSFRSWYDYSGGGMTDWGAHHFDLAQWGLGKDHTGPVEIIPPDGAEYPHLTFKYADGVKMIHSSMDINEGVTFIGTEGKVWTYGVVGGTRFEPTALGHMHGKPDETPVTQNTGNHGHTHDFIDAVRTRRRPNADVEIGYHTVTICHLGNIAYRLKRPLKWDPDKEVFVGDEDANRYLDRARRQPWEI